MSTHVTREQVVSCGRGKLHQIRTEMVKSVNLPDDLEASPKASEVTGPPSAVIAYHL